MRTAVARVEPAVAVAAGCALLLARPPGPAAAVAGIFGLLGAMAVLAPVPARTPRLIHPAIALALGVAAVAAAPLVVGPAPPVRTAGLAGAALTTLAAVSEEAFFRRLLYGRLERWGAAVAVGASALVFALVHIPFYGPAAFPVDLGAGLLFGWQRWSTGGWWVPAATHAWANLLVVMM